MQDLGASITSVQHVRNNCRSSEAARRWEGAHSAGAPVIEADKVSSAQAQQGAAVDLLYVAAGLYLASLLEVPEQADGGGALAGGIHTGVVPPHKAQRIAVALVAPGEGGVDDVLAVAADGHKAAVRAVNEGARVHIAAAQVLHRQWQPLAVRLIRQQVQ